MGTWKYGGQYFYTLHNGTGTKKYRPKEVNKVIYNSIYFNSDQCNQNEKIEQNEKYHWVLLQKEKRLQHQRLK